MDKLITLIGGTARNALSPLTFEVPPPEVKADVKAGALVRIGFEHPDFPTERMWVLVTENGKGRLRNTPVFLPMGFDELVEFQLHNVIDVMKAKDAKYI